MTAVAVLALALIALLLWCAGLSRSLHRMERTLATEADRVRSLEVQLGRARASR